MNFNVFELYIFFLANDLCVLDSSVYSEFAMIQITLNLFN
jgi:hypothetical protein